MILIVMNFWVFSQTTLTDSISKYPIKTIIDSDTVFILSQPQFVNVNKLFNKIDELTEEKENLNKKINLYKVESDKFIKIDSLLNVNLKLKDGVINSKDSIISSKDTIIDLKDIKIKDIKKQRNIAGGSGLLLLLLLLIL